jgi:hypothetical protein
MTMFALAVLASLVASRSSDAFSVNSILSNRVRTTTELLAMDDRRKFLSQAALLGSSLLLPNAAAQAEVFLDPAMYGDQENRVAAVDTLRERVRRAILQEPSLAPSFYQLALLDGLTFNAETRQGGPDGGALRLVLNSKKDDEYTRNLQKACNTLIESAIALKKYTAITIPDAIAIGGAEAIESIGGPVVSVQLGRTEGPKNTKLPDLNLDILSGNASQGEVIKAFLRAGLTEREMTALLGGLLTVVSVQKGRSTDDWRESVKPKFVQRGKMGRMSDFKRLTEEDIASMEDEYDEDPDDGWYIADSFGTRDEAFGARIGKDQIDEKTFNKFLKELNDEANPKKGKVGEIPVRFGWIASVLLDKNTPTSQAWLNKYAQSNLAYLKDLSVAFNSVTQLGAEYTGGKYESLLKNRPRKSLNDDDMKGLF